MACHSGIKTYKYAVKQILFTGVVFFLCTKEKNPSVQDQVDDFWTFVRVTNCFPIFMRNRKLLLLQSDGVLLIVIV